MLVYLLSYHGGVVDMTRESVRLSPLDGKPIGIAIDTKGPEIRTGCVSSSGLGL